MYYIEVKESSGWARLGNTGHDSLHFVKGYLAALRDSAQGSGSCRIVEVINGRTVGKLAAYTEMQVLRRESARIRGPCYD